MSDLQSSVGEAINKLLAEEEKAGNIVRVPAPRDYVYCGWCYSNGCAARFNKREARRKELDEEYLRQFPDGPKPFFTARLDNPEEMEAAKRVVGMAALEKAFGPDGGGIGEVLDNAKKEMEKRQP